MSLPLGMSQSRYADFDMNRQLVPKASAAALPAFAHATGTPLAPTQGLWSGDSQTLRVHWTINSDLKHTKRPGACKLARRETAPVRFTRRVLSGSGHALNGGLWNDNLKQDHETLVDVLPRTHTGAEEPQARQIKSS